MKLLRGVHISGGGVLPKIHPELLAKKKGGKFAFTAAHPPPVVQVHFKKVKLAPKKKPAPTISPSPPKKQVGNIGRQPKGKGKVVHITEIFL